MIDELHKLLEVHAHLRGFPGQYTKLKAHVESRLQQLEDSLGKKPERRLLGGANVNA